MNYTRLFHQWVKTRPCSGLGQLPHWWRSVIHTRLTAKISSNVTFLFEHTVRATIVKAVAVIGECKTYTSQHLDSLRVSKPAFSAI